MVCGTVTFKLLPHIPSSYNLMNIFLQYYQTYAGAFKTWEDSACWFMGLPLSNQLAIRKEIINVKDSVLRNYDLLIQTE